MCGSLLRRFYSIILILADKLRYPQRYGRLDSVCEVLRMGLGSRDA